MSVKQIKPTPTIPGVKSITDKLIENVVIKLGDGTEWPIIVTINVLCELEKMTGVDVTFQSAGFVDSMTHGRALLYLCLREQGAQYTLEEVGKLATGHWILIKLGLATAFNNAMVQKEDAAQIELINEKLGELKAAG